MLNLSLLDWLAIVGYFVVITAVGIVFSKNMRNMHDFFMGGNRFGKITMIFFSFGAGTSGNDAVGVSSKVYSTGISGIWYQWLWLFCTPFYWLIPPIMRRMRVLTTADYFEARFSPSVGSLYAIVGVLQLTVNIGVILVGSSATIEAVTNGVVPRYLSIILMSCCFVLYGVAGGLGAAIITDFIQGILTVIFSFMLVPIGLSVVGGISGLKEKIYDPSMLKLIAPGEMNLFYVIVLCVNALVGVVTQPHILGNCAAGRTELDGRFGLTGGNLLKRFCTVAWAITGLCAVIIYPGLRKGETDMVFGMMARDYLPGVSPGLLGLFVSALIASVMSSCDAFMVSSSALFTQNIYRKYLVKNKEETHYLKVGRIVAIIVVVCGIVFAFQIPNVPRGLEIFFAMQAMMGPIFWLGLIWRRTTTQAAWASTLGSFAVFALTSTSGFNDWASSILPEFMIWEGKLRVSWQMLAYLCTGFSLGILVSLITTPLPDEKLNRVYTCLYTPVVSGEKYVAPFTLPEEVSPSIPKKLLPFKNIEIPYPTFTDLLGFIIVWIIVILLIVFMYSIF
ncbi:MAG: sodium:solute symporter family protein [Candidatus Hydrogenedentes bacterium]|nr:sodium:solute symporter family protein [Candidatus Hydrogenedentota bacterium]